MQNPSVTLLLMVTLGMAFLTVVGFTLFLAKSGSISPFFAAAILVTDALFKGMIIAVYLRQRR